LSWSLVCFCPWTGPRPPGTLAAPASITSGAIPRPGGAQEVAITLFVAQHRHLPEDCPAATGNGPLLLSRVSTASAARYGVTIEAEALLDGEHLLLLVLQAPSREAVERFLAFLPGRGNLRVRPACTAEQAVQRGGCGPASAQGRG
jgi:hypothetical protein